MNHLLINCDISWASDQNKLIYDLKERFDEVLVIGTHESMLEYDLSQITHWITNPAPREKITKSLLTKLPKLRWIGSPSTGVTHFDRNVFDSEVEINSLKDLDPQLIKRITSSSEHTLFLFLCLVRKSWNCLSADLLEWRSDLTKFRGRQICGMEVLIFGCGRIGGNTARYLSALGCTVYVYDPSIHVEVPLGVRRLTHSEMLSQLRLSDAIFLCFHWSHQNSKFFSRFMMEKMQDHSYIVNTSRGENIDEEALADLIESGKFAGVALDVLSREQGASFAESRLVQLSKTHDRLIITPHIAGASHDSERLAFEFICEACDLAP